MEPPPLENQESQVSLWTAEDAQLNEQKEAKLATEREPLTKQPQLPSSSEDELKQVEATTLTEETDDDTLKANVHDAQVETPETFHQTDFFEKKPGPLKPELNETPQAFLERIATISTRGDMAYYTSLPGDYWLEFRTAFMNLFDFTGLSIVQAVRYYAALVPFPREAMEIDRVAISFGSRYHDCNPVFDSPDTAYLMTHMIMLMNTTIHNPYAKSQQQNADAFVRMFMNAYSCESMDEKVKPDTIRSIYKSIEAFSLGDPREIDPSLPFTLPGAAFIYQTNEPWQDDTSHPYLVLNKPLGYKKSTGVVSTNREILYPEAFQFIRATFNDASSDQVIAKNIRWQKLFSSETWANTLNSLGFMMPLIVSDNMSAMNNESFFGNFRNASFLSGYKTWGTMRTFNDTALSRLSNSSTKSCVMQPGMPPVMPKEGAGAMRRSNSAMFQRKTSNPILPQKLRPSSAATSKIPPVNNTWLLNRNLFVRDMQRSLNDIKLETLFKSEASPFTNSLFLYRILFSILSDPILKQKSKHTLIPEDSIAFQFGEEESGPVDYVHTICEFVNASHRPFSATDSPIIYCGPMLNKLQYLNADYETPMRRPWTPKFVCISVSPFSEKGSHPTTAQLWLYNAAEMKKLEKNAALRSNHPPQPAAIVPLLHTVSYIDPDYTTNPDAFTFAMMNGSYQKLRGRQIRFLTGDGGGCEYDANTVPKQTRDTYQHLSSSIINGNGKKEVIQSDRDHWLAYMNTAAAVTSIIHELRLLLVTKAQTWLLLVEEIKRRCYEDIVGLKKEVESRQQQRDAEFKLRSQKERRNSRISVGTEPEPVTSPSDSPELEWEKIVAAVSLDSVTSCNIDELAALMEEIQADPLLVDLLRDMRQIETMSVKESSSMTEDIAFRLLAIFKCLLKLVHHDFVVKRRQQSKLIENQTRQVNQLDLAALTIQQIYEKKRNNQLNNDLVPKAVGLQTIFLDPEEKKRVILRQNAATSSRSSSSKSTDEHPAKQSTFKTSLKSIASFMHSPYLYHLRKEVENESTRLRWLRVEWEKWRRYTSVAATLCAGLDAFMMPDID